MNIKKFFSCALLGLPLLVSARPATTEVITQTNPDGSVVSFRLHGNEQFSYYTDVDGVNILEFDNKGYLAPAIRNGRVMTTSMSDINLLRAEKIPVSQPLNEGISRMAALDLFGRTTYPTLGDIPALVILLEYADTPFSTENPKETFDKLCNEKGYSDFGSCGSARDYYIDASNGLFRPQFNVYGPVKLSHDAAFYVGDDPDKPDYQKAANFGYAIQEAVLALDDEINYADYDLDGDGKIDNIFFFYSGRGQADTGDKTKVWPHQADYWRYCDMYMNTIGLPRLYVDGVEMRTYACSNELNSSQKIPASKKPYIDGIGAFVHEYGHVLGLPDMYDTYDQFSSTSTPDKFDVMAKGSYNDLSTRPPMFSAYEKWVCNWLEYDEAEDGKEYVLPSISTGENAKAVRIKVGAPGGRVSGEYFVFESRTAEGWDSSLGQDGLVIWQINYDKNAWSQNIVNVNNMSNIDIVRPEKTNPDMMVWPGEEGAFTYLTPETPDFKLVPYHYPNAFKVWISNIKYDPETRCASFEYNKYTEIPELTTVLHDAPLADNANNNVQLVWDAAPGATDYLLTIKMKDVFGREIYYSDYNNFSTEGATSATILIPSAYWDTEFTAYVTPFCGYPSKTSSNEIKFVPSKLHDISAVEVIEADNMNVYGLHGRIEAPAGARVFNLSGTETGKENLPAGIYLVNFNGKTAKVVVK